MNDPNLLLDTDPLAQSLPLRHPRPRPSHTLTRPAQSKRNPLPPRPFRRIRIRIPPIRTPPVSFRRRRRSGSDAGIKDVRALRREPLQIRRDVGGGEVGGGGAGVGLGALGAVGGVQELDWCSFVSSRSGFSRGGGGWKGRQWVLLRMCISSSSKGICCLQLGHSAVVAVEAARLEAAWARGT